MHEKAAEIVADLVNPVRWSPLDEATRWIRLRCGAYGTVREVEATNAEATSLEADVERGLAQIAAAVARFGRVGMMAASRAFSDALERDLVGPDDFGESER
jgi:hypothetical protein